MIFAFVALVIILFSFALIASFSIEMGFYLKSICRFKTDSKEVMLSFDDGPHPVFTTELLDLLLKKTI